MSRIEVQLLDRSRCSAEHVESGARLETDAAPEFGGGGSGFSSTDLVAAALGTCIGSSLAPIALREGIPLAEIRISVVKELAAAPRRIERLAVTIALPAGLGEKQVTKLTRAAHTCAVHRSLGTTVEVEVWSA